EVFNPDRLGDAISRFYERYAELFPDGRERTRAAATARSIAILYGPLDLDRYATAIAADVEFRDHRMIGFPSTSGAQELLRSLRTLLETTDAVATRADDVLALRSDAILTRWTTSGTASASGGTFEYQFLRLSIFGIDGLITRVEQFDADRDAEA